LISFVLSAIEAVVIEGKKLIFVFPLLAAGINLKSGNPQHGA
jgi:hypothetical protein